MTTPITSSDLIQAARARTRALSVADAMSAKGTTLVDLREGDERALEGLIPEAFHGPRGLLELLADPEDPRYNPVFSGEKPLILFCSDGRRAALGARTLLDMGLSQVSHLEGGFAAWKASGGSVEELVVDGLIDGIGGVFFKARDAESLRGWYAETLGLPIDMSWGGCAFSWREAGDPSVEGSTTFSIFKDDSAYFGDSGQRFMLNFRVRDLDGLIAKLAAAGTSLEGEVVDEPYGRFAWFVDPEGHKVELWQPVGGL